MYYAIFKEDQFCDGRLIHKANKKHEIISEENGKYYIREFNCPKDKHYCSSFSIEFENDLFTIIEG
jgi:hypothetical protein